MLQDFCRSVVLRHGLSSSIMDGILAREFAGYFALSSQPTLTEFRQLCEQLDIDISARRLPSEIGAHHYLDRRVGRYKLEYDREQWVGTSEFKVAHDLYEIIQETFEKAYPGYKAPRNPAVPTCMAPYANTFAAALVMNDELMRSSVFETGFDIVELHNRFSKSYSAIAIRTLEVLKADPDNTIEVLIAIYDRREEEKEIYLWRDCSREKFRATYVTKTPGFRKSAKTRSVSTPGYPRWVVPQKGDSVVPGGLVDEVINGARSLYIERVYGFDLWGYNDLAALAVPVIWHRKDKIWAGLAKVILIVMPCQQASLLEPQLRKIKPSVIPERFQFI